MNLIYTLKENNSQYSKIEKKVADCFLNNLHKIPFLTIFDLAKIADVSATSITRFVKKYFGLSFQETKVYLTKEIASEEQSQIGQVLSWADNLNELPHKMVVEINRVLSDVLAGNDIELLRLVVDCINKARIVYLVAVGAASIYAIDLQQKLLKIGINAAYHFDGHLNMLHSSIATKHDVVLAFSHSGQTKEVNQAIRESKKNKVKIISFTSTLDSNLAKLSDIIVHIPSFENNELRLSSIFSRYENFFLIDCIFIELAKLRIKDPKTFSDNYRFMLNGLKEEKQ